MSLLDDFCFVFDKKSNISYSLFYNVLNRKNTFELFFPSKHRTSTLGKIWNKRFRKYFVGWIRKDHGRKYYGKIVIFTNESLMHISNSLLKKIKKHSKATVLFFIDEFFNDYRTVKRAKKILYQNQKYFDLVYTFTPNDVKKYGLRLNESYYSKFDVHAGKERSDIFFIGNLKARGKILDELYDLFSSKKIASKFYVYADKRSQETNINFKYQLTNYMDSIEHVISTNVILDLVDERQTGMTLRYYEAVVYNKKLLTNNKNIVHMKYYDPKYMKIFTSISDIDMIDPAWFRTSNVNYNYGGEFEPKHFLDTIIRDLDVVKICKG